MKHLLVFINFAILFLGFPTILAAETPDPRIDEVLEFWFGPLASREESAETNNDRWFGANPAFDQEIRTHFEPLVLAASKRELDSWKNAPRGRLALILILDQFTRNIYRNTPQAFAYDSMAQELTLQGLATEEDLTLLPIERVFFYLPLEHAENLELQNLSVSKFKDLLSSVSDSQKSLYESNLDYAQRHQEIIAKFGRFPHRNKILQRTSTSEELEFLTGPRSSF